LKPLSDHSKKSAEERRNDWKIRPGYSSGASSYDGSEIGEDLSTRDLNRSGILDLVNLRQEMQEKGGIATNVVRIEVCILKVRCLFVDLLRMPLTVYLFHNNIDPFRKAN
jgi:hypothetical protein